MTRTISKLMVKTKKSKLTPEFHTLQPFSKPKLKVFQTLISLVQLVFLILVLINTTQELQPWTQMVQFGKELTSMTVQSTDTRRETMTRTIFKLMVNFKRPKLTPESHTPPPFSKHQLKVSQLLYSLVQQVSHMLMLVVLTIQELQLWTQML